VFSLGPRNPSSFGVLDLAVVVYRAALPAPDLAGRQSVKPPHVLGARIELALHVVEDQRKFVVFVSGMQLGHAACERLEQRQYDLRAFRKRLDEHPPAIVRVIGASREASSLEPINHSGNRAGGQASLFGELACRSRACDGEVKEAQTFHVRRIQADATGHGFAKQNGLSDDLAGNLLERPNQPRAICPLSRLCTSSLEFIALP